MVGNTKETPFRAREKPYVAGNTGRTPIRGKSIERVQTRTKRETMSHAGDSRGEGHAQKEKRLRTGFRGTRT